MHCHNQQQHRKPTIGVAKVGPTVAKSEWSRDGEGVPRCGGRHPGIGLEALGCTSIPTLSISLPAAITYLGLRPSNVTLCLDAWDSDIMT